MTTNSELLIDGNRGVYIPQLFAQNYQAYIANTEELTEELSDLVAGPDNENYWDSWVTVLDNARMKNDDLVEGSLYQDSDLWFIPDSEIDEIPEQC